MNVESWKAHQLSRCLDCGLPHKLVIEGEGPLARCDDCGDEEEL